MNRQYELELRNCNRPPGGDARFRQPEYLPVHHVTPNTRMPRRGDWPAAGPEGFAIPAAGRRQGGGCISSHRRSVPLAHRRECGRICREPRARKPFTSCGVGLRRPARCAPPLFGGEFRNPEFEAVRLPREGARATAGSGTRSRRVLSPSFWSRWPVANGSQQAFFGTPGTARWKHGVGLSEMRFAAVSGPRLHMFMRELADITDGRGWPVFPPYQGRECRKGTARLSDACGTRRRTDSCTQTQAGLQTWRGISKKLSSPERHALRVELKKLRYAAEFFVPFFDPSQARKFLDRLAAHCRMCLAPSMDVAVAKSILLEKLVSFAGSDDPFLDGGTLVLRQDWCTAGTWNAPAHKMARSDVPPGRSSREPRVFWGRRARPGNAKALVPASFRRPARRDLA